MYVICACACVSGRFPAGNLEGPRATGSLPLMMVRRVLPLLVGLWACSALGQVTATPVTASESILLSDAGVLNARAYWVTGGTPVNYVMANAGALIQVFATNGTALPSLSAGAGGGFLTFAVANNVVNGATTTTTLVAATEFGSSACSTAVCLRVYFWDPVGNFQEQTSVSPINTTSFTATAMAIDATSSPINIYYSGAASVVLYEQGINVNASTGAVSLGGLNSRFLNALGSNNVKGLAVDTNLDATLFLSDSQSNLYTFPLDVTNLDGGIFKQTDAGFAQLDGISFFNNAMASTLVGGGVPNGVYVFDAYPTTSFVLQQFRVFAQDGGATLPSAASLDSTGTLMAVTEDINGGVGPWLHIVNPDAGPPPVDAGSDAGTDGGVVVDAGVDAGGIPTIPIIAPGPGAAPGPTNSCNCSSAGSAPGLLVLLLPLLVPRRRR